MRPTIKSVAAAAGVSTATVSYVLSGRSGKDGSRSGSGVAPATVLRVQEAALALGYRPNQSARAIRTGRTNLLMLSLTMISDPWALDVSRAVGTAAARRGITPMILADTDWRVALKRQNADVTFIDGADEPGDVELLAQAARLQRLVVFSDTMEPEGFDVVRPVVGSSCDLAVEHLTARHRRVACLISSAPSMSTLDIRLGATPAALPRLVWSTGTTTSRRMTATDSARSTQRFGSCSVRTDRPRSMRPPTSPRSQPSMRPNACNSAFRKTSK
ncbi:maltose regulon regulatory protein MalI [Arthrobacter sp. Hiyo1]|nr:maltose regulon regulatory protein MalI [Arthrobacter sp. Hiyo1]